MQLLMFECLSRVLFQTSPNEQCVCCAGLNPLTVDVIGLAGQAKFASDPVGGVVSIFGFTVFLLDHALL
jgi:hypothetical protein